MVEDVSAESVAAVIAALVGLVTVMYRAPKVYRRLKNWWGGMFGIGDLKTGLRSLTTQMALHVVEEDTALESLAKQLDFVVAELHPNGGASIRDSLNRIELRQVLQEQRQRAILSDMSIGVFETDEAGSCVWANRKYLRLTGRTFDEIKGSGWINILSHECRDRVVLAWEHAILEQREFSEELDIVTPDGELTHCHAQSYKMSDENDTIGYLGMLTPIDEHGRRMKS